MPNLFYQLFTLHFKAYKKITILTLSLLRFLVCFIFHSIQVFFIKSFPVAFVLMSEKSLALYNAVMEKILETLQEIDPDREGNCAVRLISDFEEGILRALHKLLVHKPESVGFITGRSVLTFENWTISSKLFVFQAIYRRACDEDLARFYRTSPVVKRIIKLIIALALLPAEQIYAGFTVKQFF